MLCVYITSKYCPKCHTFEFGKVIFPDGRIFSDEKPWFVPYKVVKSVCELARIPLVDLHVHDDYEIHAPPKLIRGVLRHGVVAANINKYWVGEVLNRPSIELPGFLILSNLTKTRYIGIEIITEARSEEALLVTKYSATRQCLRAIARTAIEEKIVLSGKRPTPEMVEYLLHKLFPVDEEGEPNVSKWVRGFIQLRHMKIRW